MKVVLFCGGLGTRLREHSDTLPKPLVNVGYRPILWHLMRYYAHYGYKDFILALGYRGDMVREYFLHYNECMSNDFVMSQGGKKIELLSSDIDDWRITFVDTGLHSNIGQRLLRQSGHVEDVGEHVIMGDLDVERCQRLAEGFLPEIVDPGDRDPVAEARQIPRQALAFRSGIGRGLLFVHG